MIFETRIRARVLAAIAVVLLVALTAADAHADTRLNGANQRWQTADKCTRSSFAAYPDYTVEAAQKRDRYVQACLRNNRLPPRPDLAPAEPSAATQQ